MTPVFRQFRGPFEFAPTAIWRSFDRSSAQVFWGHLTKSAQANRVDQTNVPSVLPPHWNTERRNTEDDPSADTTVCIPGCKCRLGRPHGWHRAPAQGQ